MSVHVAAGATRTYRANEHETLLSEVATVHCILMPRAFLLAGFDDKGKVAIARYNSYETSVPEWDPAFFEKEFMNEPLLGVPQQLKAIFVGSGQAMLVPATLYEADAAREWLGSLSDLAPDDVLHTYKTENPAAQYVFALPQAIEELVRTYFSQTPVLPVTAYHFNKPSKNGYLFQCLLTNGKAIASLYQLGHLLWHQQFAFTCAEDIAWQAANLCRELHIPRIDLNLQVTMLCDDCDGMAAELERYFPKIKWSADTPAEGGEWAPAIYLLQQLYACAL